jgi:hypothetical protein
MVKYKIIGKAKCNPSNVKNMITGKGFWYTHHVKLQFDNGLQVTTVGNAGGSVVPPDGLSFRMFEKLNAGISHQAMKISEIYRSLQIPKEVTQAINSAKHAKEVQNKMFPTRNFEPVKVEGVLKNIIFKNEEPKVEIDYRQQEIELQNKKLDMQYKALELVDSITHTISDLCKQVMTFAESVEK